MKRYILPLSCLLVPFFAQAQSIDFISSGVTYSFPAAVAGEMTFDGNTVTVADRPFDLSEWSLIKVNESDIESKTVEVTFSGSTASVVIAGDIASYIEASTDGAHVTITQSDLVSDATCGEITYVLKGESDNGSLTLIGSYKSTLELRGLSLTNPAGAALDIQNGKRIDLSAKNGTANFLTDGPGSQKGALSCNGHLEFKGKGSLTVKGNQSHAIYAKEYVEMKNLTLDITGAVKDGINCQQYFLMESGTLTIAGTGDDGIQTSYKDKTDREDEDTGTITINGGTLSIAITADASKCLKADADIIVNDGNITLSSSANGIWDKTKTKSSSCISSDGDVTIAGGTLDIRASGSGGKGISCDGIFHGEGGKITIATTGGLLVYTNGSLNHNYTQSAERIDSNYKSSAKGIKADSGVVINDGEFYITTATNNAEGIESKKDLEINGGKIFVKAYDDGINSSDDFRVSGGNLTVISIVGDGLDSNGNLYISGGHIRTMGSGGMEMGLDANTETGCAVYITGGTLLAFGGSNTYPSKSGSTQAFVRGSGAIKAGSDVAVKSGDIILASFTVPEEYNSNASPTPPKFGPGNGPGGGGWTPGGSSGNGSIMISCPDLVSGSSYTIDNDGTLTSATATLTSSGR